MTGRTHGVIGMVVGVVLAPEATLLGFVKGSVIGWLGGRLPDLDHPDSSISHDLAPMKIGSRRVTFLMVALCILWLWYREWLPFSGVVVMAVWLGITAFAKHRGFTHSVAGLVLATVAVYLLAPEFAWIFAGVYLSHLLIDIPTDGGVPLFWPWKKRIRIPTLLNTGEPLCNAVEWCIRLGSLYWLYGRFAPFAPFFDSGGIWPLVDELWRLIRGT